ncbi:MAG: DUF86 domain-containing protein [Deltaproteobacteria bacterium]|nr:MAG: DUF86 domain-containing protein [Deltaproteobacteria bacterium]
MTGGKLKEKVVVEKASWVRRMLQQLRQLPIEDEQTFLADPRNPAAAESFLRRAIEALLDLGRHVLARAFGVAVVEYKEIAIQLGAHGVILPGQQKLLREIAGYKNRLVHFYDEIGPEELYRIICDGTGDIADILDAILEWVNEHPQLIDRS